MENISEIVPLVSYLGVKSDDEGLARYLATFGGVPKLKITEYTASMSFKKYGIALEFIDEEWTVEKGGQFTKGTWILRAFFLYSNGHEGFDQYKGPLPGILAFFDHRAMVKVKLGEPHSTGGGNKFGTVTFPLRDQYRYEHCDMSVSYQEEKTIMVTFMSLKEAKRFSSRSS